jgi:hypothetical protein
LGDVAARFVRKARSDEIALDAEEQIKTARSRIRDEDA